jgi:general secretion pathway protein D
VNEGQKKAAKASGAKTTATPSAASKEIDIQADEETNALVITAAPDAMKNIESVIRQLDIRRAQVHVEAIIVEVSGDVNKELGFSYLFGKEIGQSGDDSSTPPVGGALLGTAGDSLTAIGAAAAANDSTLATGALGTGFTLGFGSQSSSGDIFAGIFKAVSSNSNSNILSTPSIVTLDNEEAEITVGESRPFATGSFTTSSSGGSNPFSTTEQKDVGLKLKIKPQINEGDTIRLDIEQETSSVDTAASIASAAAGAPGTVTNKRTIKTSVLIEDGQLIVLGGLIQDSKAKSIAKIPLLGDIPLLGRLFQYRTNKNIKTNLMVFLHPTIIRDRVSADRKSQEKYTLMRAKQLEAGHKAKILDIDTSMLPELNVYFTDKTAEPVVEGVETLNPEVVEAEANAS